MSLPGGTADKVGNLYEDLWTAHVALDVLAGEAIDIRLEKVDAIVGGYEFEIRYPDRREFHQVKKQRTGKGKWTIADLAREGIFRNFAKLLTHYDDASCTFASAEGTSELAELTEARADKADSYAEFLAFLTSKQWNKNYDKLKEQWVTASEETVFNWLQRIRAHNVDEAFLRGAVAERAGGLLDGQCSSHVDALVGALRSQVNKTVSTEKFWNLLREKGYGAHPLRTKAIPLHAIEAANSRYIESRKSTLVGGQLLSRSETPTILNALTTSRLVWILGKAGIGKSDVLLGVIEGLKQTGVPFLVMRLDTLAATGLPDEMGRSMGLPAAPQRTLAAISDGQDAVLIVDQLDTLSNVSGRNPGYFECVSDMVRRAFAIPNLRVLLSCRSFDYENDLRLRTLRPSEGISASTQTVGLLDLSSVNNVLEDLGRESTKLSPRQRELLRTPLHLSLFTQIERIEPPIFGTPHDLFDQYWKVKSKEIEAKGGVPSQWATVIETLVDYMSANGVLVAPCVLVDQSSTTAEAMESAGVLIRDRNSYGFFHELFFDYAYARTFVRKQKKIQSLLAEGQLLFRRGQVRAILAFLRESADASYIGNLTYLLRDAEVRFHLKDVTMDWLAQVMPNDAEWSIVSSILLDETSFLQSRAWNLMSHEAWFRKADEHDALETCMRSSSEKTRTHASFAVYSAMGFASARVAVLLQPYEANPLWRMWIESCISQVNDATDESFFRLILRTIRGHDLAANDERSEVWSIAAANLGKTKPAWACELVGTYLRNRLAASQEHKFENPFRPRAKGEYIVSPNLHLNDLPQIAAADPIAFVEHVIAEMLNYVRAYREEGSHDAPSRDSIWQLRHYGSYVSFDEILLNSAEVAMQQLACNHTKIFLRFLTVHKHTDDQTTLHLLYEGFKSSPARFGNRAIRFVVSDVKRFQVGRGFDHWSSTRELLNHVLPSCDADHLRLLEDKLLLYFPREPEHGYAQFSLLGAIPEPKRSVTVKKRFAEWQRKFNKQMASPTSGIFGGLVKSPIRESAVELMTDKQWIAAIAKYTAERQFGGSRTDFLKGGASQLAFELEKQVRLNPARFAKLALQLPDNTNHYYFDGILRGIDTAETKIDIELTGQVMNKCHRLANRPCGRWLPGALKAHAQSVIPTELLETVNWYASAAADPHSETTASGSDLLNYGLNTTRGSAASTIAALIAGNRENIGPLQTGISSLAQDPIVAVRAMAGEILLSLELHNQAQANAYFAELISDCDDRLLATHYVGQFIWNGLEDNASQMRPVVTTMLASAHSDVRNFGARCAAMLGLLHIEYEPLAAGCLCSDDTSSRHGAVAVYVGNLKESRFRARCETALTVCFADRSPEVQNEAARAIGRMEGSDLKTFELLVSNFFRSPAFQGNERLLLHAIEEATTDTTELTFLLCEYYFGALTTLQMDNAHHYNAGASLKLLLRVFSNGDATQKEKALELYDSALIRNVYGAPEALKEHDRG